MKIASSLNLMNQPLLASNFSTAASLPLGVHRIEESWRLAMDCALAEGTVAAGLTVSPDS